MKIERTYWNGMEGHMVEWFHQGFIRNERENFYPLNGGAWDSWEGKQISGSCDCKFSTPAEIERHIKSMGGE